MLDRPTRALVRLAAAIARGDEPVIDRVAREAVADGVSVLWGDELLLQSVLMVGYPRALGAARQWREVTGAPAASLEDGGDLAQAGAWQARGEATCAVIYGAHYAKLRANVAALHPALDAWMVTEGYGRTLSRPGLDLMRREFAIVAQVMVLGAERQLHSHLKGARHAGASTALVQDAIRAAGPLAGSEAVAMAERLLDRIG